MSGERIVLVSETRNLNLEGKHNALNDRPTFTGNSVLEKIESYLFDSGRINLVDLRKRTPFFSKDQREHILEHVRSVWTSQIKEKKQLSQTGYREESHIREAKNSISLVTSFRDIATGRFVKKSTR